jgi:hypothetical protein
VARECRDSRWREERRLGLGADDYFAARPITSPFGLFDCDVPCDGSIAVVVSEASIALQGLRSSKELCDNIFRHIRHSSARVVGHRDLAGFGRRP